jgi:hypothetical protein
MKVSSHLGMLPFELKATIMDHLPLSDVAKMIFLNKEWKHNVYLYLEKYRDIRPLLDEKHQLVSLIEKILVGLKPNEHDVRRKIDDWTSWNSPRRVLSSLCKIIENDSQD